MVVAPCCYSQGFIINHWSCSPPAGDNDRSEIDR